MSINFSNGGKKCLHKIWWEVTWSTGEKPGGVWVTNRVDKPCTKPWEKSRNCRVLHPVPDVLCVFAGTRTTFVPHARRPIFFLVASVPHARTRLGPCTKVGTYAAGRPQWSIIVGPWWRRATHCTGRVSGRCYAV